MPRKTFENLPAEKQLKIKTAIKGEFLTHPYGEISINRIIKDADIPRGSIYQYFEGKEDMLFFVMKDYCSYFINMIKIALEENKGDLFDTLEVVLDQIFHNEDGTMEKKGYGILFSDSRVAELITDVSRCDNSCPGEIMVVAAVRPYLDLSDLDLISKEEEDIFLEILVESLCKPVVSFLNDGIDRYEECMAKAMLLKKHFTKTRQEAVL